MNKKNQVDKNGRPHGLCEKYYSNGELSCRGCYKNGHRHGLWEWYFTSGGLSTRFHFKNGNKHGPCEDYSFNRRLLYKGYCKRAVRVGLWYNSYS